jgi:hypothetical protein
MFKVKTNDDIKFWQGCNRTHTLWVKNKSVHVLLQNNEVSCNT